MGKQQYQEPDFTGGVSDLMGQNQPQPAPQEPVFKIDDKEVPLSQLPPETVKEWYDAHTNRAKWQQANTTKAQEIAAQRKELEKYGDPSEISRKVEQYDQLAEYFKQHPDLEQTVLRYMATNQGNVAAAGGQQMQNAMDPATAQVVQELRQQNQELTNRLQKIESGFEERTISDERKNAYEAIKQLDPNFDQQKFDEYLNDVTGKMDNLSELYKVLYYAQQGMNKDQIVAQAQKQTLENVQKGAPSVERGNAAPAAQLPQNIDSTMDLDEMFDKFSDELGIAEETPIIEQ